MAFVSAELMERTWRKVAAFDRHQIIRLQKTHQKAQKPLAIFVYNSAEHVREEAGGVLFWVFHVVLEAFRHAEPRPARVSKRQIDNTLAIHASVRHPSSQHHGQAMEEIPTSEPHAMEYAFEALKEVDDPALTSEEVEGFLRTLSITVESLHAACRRN